MSPPPWPCIELAPELLEWACGELLCVPAPVHVWHWRTDFEESRCASLLQLLSPAERDKAASFRFPQDRARSLIAHAGLRRILGAYLGLSPEGISFAVTATGKPCLADAAAVSFNLAHSGAFAAAAVSRGRDIGIDLEQIRPGPGLGGIAERFFSPAERAWLESQTGQWLEGFYRLWTAKEAILKAAGTGLAAPLDQAPVRPGADAPPWHLRELDLAGGYAATVAFSGAPAPLRVLTPQG
jgi:4'-phosphopantetheinyl transferase